MQEQHMDVRTSDIDDTSLDTSVSHKPSSMQKLRALGLIALGAVSGVVGGGIAAHAKGTDEEAMEALKNLETRILTLDVEQDTLVEKFREAMERQALSGDNISEINRLLSELIESDRLQSCQLDEQANTDALIAADIRTLDRGLQVQKQDLERHKESVREPSPEELWNKIMAPTVKLEGRMSVGSGVIIGSRKLADGSGYESFVLTNRHVTEGLKMDWKDSKHPEPFTAKSFAGNGRETELKADLLAEGATLDVSLLRIVTKEEISHTVKLPTRSELAQALKVFREVYNAGCPTGVDPIPGKGEITDVEHQLGFDKMMLVSSPTIPGNSGGPVIDADSFLLLGLTRAVYSIGVGSDGSVRQYIPHMSLVIPIDQVYDWLEKSGHEDLVPKEQLQDLAQATPKAK
ncbi:MAG: trypsin-like peptidase domain-containing protein [Bdellovibrionales bacterium]|nr:trypsin-like peptidase domain-containing protein [Bdellovibrionales bacterium]